MTAVCGLLAVILSLTIMLSLFKVAVSDQHVRDRKHVTCACPTKTTRWDANNEINQPALFFSFVPNFGLTVLS